MPGSHQRHPASRVALRFTRDPPHPLRWVLRLPGRAPDAVQGDRPTPDPMAADDILRHRRGALDDPVCADRARVDSACFWLSIFSASGISPGFEASSDFLAASSISFNVSSVNAERQYSHLNFCVFGSNTSPPPQFGHLYDCISIRPMTSVFRIQNKTYLY